MALGIAVAHRARKLGLETRERADCHHVILRDYARRTGRLRDRRQPGPPCCLIPAPGLRVDVTLNERGWRYDLRRAKGMQ